MFKRLARQVCPRAPFLVPRSVLQGSRPASRCVSLKKKVSGRERFKKFTLPAQQKSIIRTENPSLASLHEALGRNSWEEVDSIYPDIATSVLSHNDTFQIARLLHTTLRANESAKDAAGQRAKQKLLTATDRLVDLYKRRVLPPHSGASLHLLSIYKENQKSDKTKELWHWLSAQEGNDYVSQAVYGAAIEALACAGEPLADLETLYDRALIRFPGNFASYHLSPEAVVPDRGQPAFSKNIPISLLQGIFTARMLNGDWKNAYLAFDVVLRLIPDRVPKRFFDLIIAQRPFAEAVHVYQLANLIKVLSSARNSKILLKRAAAAAEFTSTRQKLNVAIIAIDLLEAEIHARRPLDTLQVSQVIKILIHTAWDGRSCESEVMKPFNVAVAECGSRLVKICSPYISSDLGSTLNAMLSLAGKTRHKQLVVEVCEIIEDLDAWNEVTHRALVTCVGMSCCFDGLEDAWQLLMKRARQESRELNERDWLCLAGAVNRIDSPAATAFATEQLALHDVSPQLQTRFRQACKPWPGYGKQGREPAEEELFDAIGALGKALDWLEGRTKDSNTTSDYRWHNPYQKAANALSSDPFDGGAKNNAQTVYNELTVDPLRPLPNHTEEQLSKAGIPFDALRFIHWKFINYLLLLAEGIEKSKKRAVEDAIAEGTSLKFDEDRESEKLSISVSFPTNLEKYRLRILELRGRIE